MTKKSIAHLQIKTKNRTSTLGVVDSTHLRIRSLMIGERARCSKNCSIQESPHGVMLQEFPIALQFPNQFESYRCFINFYYIIAINLLTVLY